MQDYDIMTRDGVFSTIQASNHREAVDISLSPVYPRMKVEPVNLGEAPDVVVRGVKETKFFRLVF